MSSQIELVNNVNAAVLAAIPEPIFVFDENGCYVEILGGVDQKKYHDGQHLIGKRIHDVIDVELADKFLYQIKKAIQSGQVLNYIYQLSAKDILGSDKLPGPEGQQWFEAHISPIKEIKGQPRIVIWVTFNITKLHETLIEKDSLILDLQKANSEIKTLQGILPICTSCKKIRDDKGYWNQIEGYIQKYSDAKFSHSLCPECSDKLYGNEDWYIEMKKDKKPKDNDCCTSHL